MPRPLSSQPFDNKSVKKRLDQYSGRLSAAQIAEGINLARRNACRLASDAVSLLDAGRLPSATALAVLAIEEAGKCSILREIALARDEKELIEAWRAYRSHTTKNRTWPFVELFLKGARKLSDFAPLFSSTSDHPYLLDQIKQISFYTDCLGDAHWSYPEDVIDADLCNSLVFTASILGKGDDIKPREIELWIQHVGPVWRSHPERMEKGLTDWYASLQAEGLKPQGKNAMRSFVLEGIIKE